jgi:hypothetical protein
VRSAVGASSVWTADRCSPRMRPGDRQPVGRGRLES